MHTLLWIAIAGVVYFLLKKFYDKEKAWARDIKLKQQAEEAEQERARLEGIARAKAHREEQLNMGKELLTLCSNSLQWFETMPKQLVTAEEHLDQAESDFHENALAPFWTSIELATSRLGAFDDLVQNISHSSDRYGKLVKAYEESAPSFPITMKSVQSMTTASKTADRLQKIVRKAQTNFQFAMIYEQRKTNQILVSGFTNLAQALDGMGNRIAESLDSISNEISAVANEMSSMSSAMQESFQSLGEQIHVGHQQIAEGLGAIHSTTMQNGSDMIERHDHTLEMLDNIQRRRKPIGSRGLKDLGTSGY